MMLAGTRDRAWRFAGRSGCAADTFIFNRPVLTLAGAAPAGASPGFLRRRTAGAGSAALGSTVLVAFAAIARSESGAAVLGVLVVGDRHFPLAWSGAAAASRAGGAIAFVVVHRRWRRVLGPIGDR